MECEATNLPNGPLCRNVTANRKKDKAERKNGNKKFNNLCYESDGYGECRQQRYRQRQTHISPLKPTETEIRG